MTASAPFPVDSGQQTYTGSITWTGTTAPSGTTNHTYRWYQIGKLIFLRVNLIYSVAGAAVTTVTMDIPAGAPIPDAISGISTGQLGLTASGDLVVNFTTTAATRAAISVGTLSQALTLTSAAASTKDVSFTGCYLAT